MKKQRLRFLRVLVAKLLAGRLLGQPIFLQTEKKQLFLWIKEGPYITAGKLYGWTGPGFGVNKVILEYAASVGYSLCIISGRKIDRYYKARFNCSSLLQFCRDRGAIERRGGVEIFVIPFTRDFFETVSDQKAVEEVVKILEGGAS